MGKNKIILEFSEFNANRMNSDTGQMAVGVDNPQLSINSFDKYQDMLRNGFSKLNAISNSLSNTVAFSYLKSKMLLDDQDITQLKILRILSSNNVNYDVYLSFIIGEYEYWGVIEDILDREPIFISEVFKDSTLIQSKEWVIKTKGLIIKHVKQWLNPKNGEYKLINSEASCFSLETGKILNLEQGSLVNVVSSHDNKITIKYDNKYWTLNNKNYVYFNYWFEEILVDEYKKTNN